MEELPRDERAREDPPERALFGGFKPAFSGDSGGMSVREIDSLGREEPVDRSSLILEPEGVRAMTSTETRDSLFDRLSELGDCGGSRSKMNS